MNAQELTHIVERAASGDASAFGQLYQAYFSPVYKYIYFRVNTQEEAEDLSQDVFLKAFTSFKNYEDKGIPALAYFYTIARTTIIDFYRKAKTPLASEEDLMNVVEESDGPHEVSAKSEEADVLKRRIKMLPEEQQHVITLRFLDDLSTKEIAEAMDKSEEAVRQIQSRGIKALRQKYETEF